MQQTARSRLITEYKKTMFNNLSEKLDKALHVLKGHGSITEVNVAETLKEVRRALLDADVNFKIAKEFTNRVKEKALGQNVLTTLQPGQLMVKIVKDELTELMGGDAAGINLSGKPTVILMSGLQGSGKTTFSGKLANFLKNKKTKKPLLVACDVYRPAAVDQLHVVGEQIKVDVYSDKGNTDPVAIAKAGIAHAKENGHNVVIIDTAGRLAVDEAMMTEISNIHKAIEPQETIRRPDSSPGSPSESCLSVYISTFQTCIYNLVHIPPFFSDWCTYPLPMYMRICTYIYTLPLYVWKCS